MTRINVAFVVAIVVAFTATITEADDYIYSGIGNGQWTRVGQLKTQYRDRAILCVDGVCGTFPCSACHEQFVDPKRYTGDVTQSHVLSYYPKAKLVLAEFQNVKIGSFVVTQLREGLVMQDPERRRFGLPTDAFIVKGRDGQPAFITYSGNTVPKLITTTSR
jgi:hypothetical protein